MTDIVNYFDHPEGLVHWMITCAVGAICEKDGTNFDDLDMDAAAIQVEFKINGYEVPFVKLIEAIERQHRDQVIEEAKKLIMLKFSGLSDKLYDLEELCTEKVDDVMRELERE